MNTAGLCIDLATPTDVAAIIAVEEAAFAAVDRFPRTTWRRLVCLAQPRGTALTLVAREGTRVVGAINALLRRSSNNARIYSLAVDPAQRGRGVGRLLITALATRLPARIQTLSLEVRIANQPARQLYEKLGFQVDRALPAYYADGGDGVRYVVARAAMGAGP